MGLDPQAKLLQYKLLEFLSNFENFKSPRKAPYWWLSVDGSGPAICKFLTTKNRRLSNSGLGLSLHTIRLVKTFFQKKAMCEIPQWLGYLFQTNKTQWKRFCYSIFTTLTQNQKMHRCVIQLKDHQIVESGKGPSISDVTLFWAKIYSRPPLSHFVTSTGWPKKMCTHKNFNCDFD